MKKEIMEILQTKAEIDRLLDTVAKLNITESEKEKMVAGIATECDRFTQRCNKRLQQDNVKIPVIKLKEIRTPNIKINGNVTGVMVAEAGSNITQVIN